MKSRLKVYMVEVVSGALLGLILYGCLSLTPYPAESRVALVVVGYICIFAARLLWSYLGYYPFWKRIIPRATQALEKWKVSASTEEQETQTRQSKGLVAALVLLLFHMGFILGLASVGVNFVVQRYGLPPLPSAVEWSGLVLLVLGLIAHVVVLLIVRILVNIMERFDGQEEYEVHVARVTTEASTKMESVLKSWGFMPPAARRYGATLLSSMILISSSAWLSGGMGQ